MTAEEKAAEIASRYKKLHDNVEKQVLKRKNVRTCMLRAGNKILQNLHPDIERQCQRGLDLLARLTIKSNTTGALDKAKNAVFSVLSYAVKEDVS